MQPFLTRLLIAASLALAPFAFAHDDQLGPGTPDFTCQTPAEWGVHDYAGANGRTVADISDNNLEECGTTYGLFIAGTPECRELEDRFDAANPESPAHALWLLLCQTDRPADYDGDLEFAIGGALLAVDSGDGETSGSIVCLGTLGHHGATIRIADEVFGSGVAFTVGADASLVAPLPGEPDCGDNVTRPCEPNNSGLGPAVDAVLDLLQTGTCNPNDHRVLCYSACTVPFGPGAEGTYVVWVHPTANAGPGGTPTGASHGHVGDVPPPPACSDGVDNDGDGAADFPADADCLTPSDDDESGPPRAPLGQVNIHRFPGQTVGYKLITSPAGWSCVDVNTGLVVSSGDALQGPNPGVTCVPPGGLNVCNSVTAGGAHAGLGIGTIFATSECAALQATQPLILPANAGTATSTTPPLQPFPWTCKVNDVGASIDSDYWIFCRVNH